MNGSLSLTIWKDDDGFVSGVEEDAGPMGWDVDEAMRIQRYSDSLFKATGPLFTGGAFIYTYTYIYTRTY